MSVYVVMSVHMPYMSLCIEHIVKIVPRFKHICAFAHFHYAYLPIINDDDDDDVGRFSTPKSHMKSLKRHFLKTSGRILLTFCLRMPNSCRKFRVDACHRFYVIEKVR